MEKQSVPITTDYIKLEALLTLANVVSSGGEAKIAIQEGEVTVNGETCTQRGKKLRPGDVAVLGGEVELTVTCGWTASSWTASATMKASRRISTPGST